MFFLQRGTYGDVTGSCWTHATHNNITRSSKLQTRIKTQRRPTGSPSHDSLRFIASIKGNRKRTTSAPQRLTRARVATRLNDRPRSSLCQSQRAYFCVLVPKISPYFIHSCGKIRRPTVQTRPTHTLQSQLLVQIIAAQRFQSNAPSRQGSL
jgi:hypothetical protein